jgi:hypothetical protein
MINSPAELLIIYPISFVKRLSIGIINHLALAVPFPSIPFARIDHGRNARSKNPKTMPFPSQHFALIARSRSIRISYLDQNFNNNKNTKNYLFMCEKLILLEIQPRVNSTTSDFIIGEITLIRDFLTIPSVLALA